MLVRAARRLEFRSESLKGCRQAYERTLDIGRSILPQNRFTATLDEIGKSFNTDKASLYQDKVGNNYLAHYEKEIKQHRHEPVLLVELGIGYGDGAGSSLRLWDEYFTHKDTRIVGVDIEPSHRRFAGGRISVEIGDCGSDIFLHELGSRYTGADLMIDDASHYWIHQVTAFSILFNYLKPGGLYIIEDLGTSFNEPVRAIYGAPGGPDAYTVLLSYAGRLVGNGFPHPLGEHLPDSLLDDTILAGIDSISLVRGAALIRKKA